MNKRVYVYYVISLRQVDGDIIELNVIENASSDYFPLSIEIDI